MSLHWLTSKTNRYEVIVVARILGECLLQPPYVPCTVFPRVIAGGDYSREVIISNISIKGGNYSREATNRETAIIQGNIRYFTGEGNLQMQATESEGGPLPSP